MGCHLLPPVRPRGRRWEGPERRGKLRAGAASLDGGAITGTCPQPRGSRWPPGTLQVQAAHLLSLAILTQAGAWGRVRPPLPGRAGPQGTEIFRDVIAKPEPGGGEGGGVGCGGQGGTPKSGGAQIDSMTAGDPQPF